MGVKETPTNFRVYYRLFIESNKQKAEEALTRKEKLEQEVEDKYKNIVPRIDDYKEEFNVDLTEYKEFMENKYITGNFYRLAKGMFVNRNNNYQLVSDLYDLYDLAGIQKEIHDCENHIAFCQKCAKIHLKDYLNILNVFYTEVHKKLVLEGMGYAFTGRTGWICVNRCILRKKKPILDYKATKLREKELKAKGLRIYNKEEAEWCAKNGIEYKAEDKRVFVTNEYCYQVPLLDCRLANGNKNKLTVTDYRHARLRGKTNEELIELCNHDIKKICELPIDLKTKVTLCDKVDKILYTKFIRNEAQRPVTFV